MALKEIPPPDALKLAFLEGLNANDSLQLQFSLPVYGLSLSALTKDAGPIRPEALGWRFVTIGPQGIAVAGEVPNETDDPEGGIATSLTRGTAIELAWKSYLAIKEHPDVLNEPFEPRLLRISSLRIEAFWLKALPVDDVLGASDRVYPFVAFQEELNSQLLPAPAFLAVVRKLAAEPIVYNAPRLS